jgi:hypothetical protein
MQFSPSISRLIPVRMLAAFIFVLLLLHMSQGAYASESPDAFGVLVMAHGGPPEWNRSVEAAVEPLRSRYRIEIAFGMADAVSMQESVRKLESQGARNIGVVRLFVSGESWYDRTRQILGIAPGAPEPPASAAHAHASGHHEHAQAHEHSMAFWRLNTKASFALTAQGLGEAPETAAILAERARALSRTPRGQHIRSSPRTPHAGQRWLAVRLNTEKTREHANGTTTRGFQPAATLAYGVVDNLDFEITLPYFRQKSDGDTVSGPHYG